MADSAADPLVEAARRVEAGEEVVLATAIRTDGTPPCRPGQKLLIARTGPVAGTLGCSEFDASAVDAAPGLLDGDGPRTFTFRHDLGAVEVYLEALRARPTLVVLSATPVAAHLLRGAAELGYTTVLIEDRGERVTEAHRAAAGRVARSVDQVRLPRPGTASPVIDVVATDHDAPALATTLAAALRSGAGYVGVMGSARHVNPHLETLRAAGLSDTEIGRLRSPVGLDLGGRTPAEIAVSILAGLIAQRTGRAGGWLDR